MWLLHSREVTEALAKSRMPNEWRHEWMSSWWQLVLFSGWRARWQSHVRVHHPEYPADTLGGPAWLRPRRLGPLAMPKIARFYANLLRFSISCATRPQRLLCFIFSFWVGEVGLLLVVRRGFWWPVGNNYRLHYVFRLLLAFVFGSATVWQSNWVGIENGR